jgi:hypothetical protein
MSDLPATTSKAVFSDLDAFKNAQRMAVLLSESQLIPETFRGKVADCVIALELANRIGASPLAVMQNLYIVHGKPAWSSQFLISCVNASGRFTPLRYQMGGVGDDYGCIAWAVDKDDERLESPRVTIKMAKDEGWFSRNGSKWKTMPDLMLRYRSATLFARTYAPELTMGIHCEDEIIDIAPVVTEPRRPRTLVEVRPVAAAAANPDDAAEAAAGLAPAPEPEKSDLTSTRAELSPQAKLANIIINAGHSFDTFQRWAIETGAIANADSLASFDEIPKEAAERMCKVFRGSTMKAALAQLDAIKGGAQ